MNAYTVDKYFLEVERGLDHSTVIGGPVYNGYQEELGIIQDYDSINGLVKVQLFDGVPYMRLLKNGVPMTHIIFGNE